MYWVLIEQKNLQKSHFRPYKIADVCLFELGFWHFNCLYAHMPACEVIISVLKTSQ